MQVESLAFGGEGIARVQREDKSMVVFLENVVPGDLVKARIIKKKRNFARAAVVEILKPSDVRIQPRCPYFSRLGMIGCGGCTWQFLDVTHQLKIKEQQVRDALQRTGKIQDDVVLPAIGGEAWYYRNKMEFSFSHTPAGVLSLGFHLKRRHYDLVELEECFLLEPFAGEMVSAVRSFFQKLTAENALDPEMKLLSFTIRVGKYSGQIMLIISAENGEEHFMEAFKKEMLKFCSDKKLSLASLFFLHVINRKGRPKRFVENLVYGSPVIEEKLCLPSGHMLRFEISPQAFFQPNTKQAEILYSKAMEAAGLTGHEIVFDLYCGTGTIGLFCAQLSKKVYGIELNASAIANANSNAKLNAITNSEFIVGDVQNVLSDLPKNPDVVMVDPPRNGLAPKVIETLLALVTPRIVYISCNPVALARDASLLSKGNYYLESVQPVDMFPQTYHIENVALFRKRPMTV